MALTSCTPGGLRLASHFLVSLSLLGGTAIASTYQAPAGEMNGLLDAVLTVEGNGRMLWTSGTAAFFPKDAHYDGSPGYIESKRCFLTLDYKGQETGRWQLLVNGDESVFQSFQGYGSLPTPIVQEEGEYELAYELDGETITSTTFNVKAKESGDPFNPATTYTVDAPLLHMAQLREDVTSSQGGLSAVFFLHRDDLGLDKGTRAQVAIEQNGRSLFSGGEISASNGGANGHWFRCDKGIRYGKEKGGGFLELQDFLRVDGDYMLTVRVKGDLKKAWPFTVQGQKLVAHARSQFTHSPRTEYLLPRNPERERGAQESITWIEPLEHLGDAAATAPVAVAVDPAAKANWNTSSAAPARPTTLVTTNVDARVDAAIAAGDGFVAYGTGPNTGVAYLKVGEDTEISLPDGATYASKAFFACGAKLVLVKGKQVVVYDTESRTHVAIPLEDVTLASSPRGLLKGGPIAADGMLVAVLTDTRKVHDRATVKVIDISGTEPRIIPLGFPDAEPNQLTSIAVDAAGGVVVVGSDRKNGIFTAPVAPGADFQFYDLSGHDGFPKDCAPIVRNGQAAVFDSTGTRKLRLVNLATGAVRSVAPLAKAERWFAFDGERVALAGNESNGSDYRVLMGKADGSAPTAPGGSGDAFGSGKLGYGQSVAMTQGGLVFTAGTGKSGIGSSEVLYVTDGTQWKAALMGDAKIPAVDVVLGEHMVAFKTGKSRDAKVAYVLLGNGSKPGDL